MSKNKYWDGAPAPPKGDVDPIEAAQDKAMVEGIIDDLVPKMIAAVGREAKARIGDAAGEHVPGRYSSGVGWSSGVFGSFSGESQDLTALKTLAPSDVLERHGKALAETYGVRRERLDAKLAAEHWFRSATIAQLPRHKGHGEAQRRIEAFETVTKTTLAGDINAQGGYAVPDIVGNEVLKIIRDASDIFKLSKQVPMTSDTLSFPDEATAVTTNWSMTQGTTLTAGEPVFGVKTLTAAKLVGRAKFSLELIDDANVAIIPFLNSCFAEKMGGDLDFAAMEGTFAAATMPFTGVANATSVSNVTVASTNGTNGATLKYEDLINTFIAPGEGITRRDGVFVCGPGLYGKIVGLVDTNGQPIVRLGTVENQVNNTLFGRPVIVSNRMSLTTIGAGTNSVGNLYYGSPSALLFGVRQGLRWEVTDFVSWSTYQADARMVGRFGFVVGVPTAWAKLVGVKVKP